MKLRIYESDYLFEDIEAVKKYYPKINDSVFMELIQLDPTYRDGSDSLGKYGKWILNLYNKGAISEDDFGEITPLLNQFTTYRNRIQNKDLNSYKTLDDLDAVVSAVVDDDSMLSDRQKLRFKKNLKAGRISITAEDDYDIVLNTSEFTVYVPNTHEASMKLGRGTDWCTAHESPVYYNSYTSDGGKLYIFVNKITGSKYQYSDKQDEFRDEYDDLCDYYRDIMSEDEEVAKFLHKLNPDMFTVIPFDENKIPLIDDVCGDFPYYVDIIQFVRIPPDCYGVNEGAFDSCPNLEEVIISGGVRFIASNAFANCESLYNITFEPSDTELLIYDGAFSGCSSLTDVALMPWVTPLEGAFDSEYLEELTFLNGYKEISEYQFRGYGMLERVNFPKSLKVIGLGAFEDCGIRNLVIPGGVKEISKDAFMYNDRLLKVKIEQGVETIEDSAFAHVFKSVKVALPTSILWIHPDAFYGTNAVLYSDSEYVKDYCEKQGIKYGGGYDDM